MQGSVFKPSNQLHLENFICHSTASKDPVEHMETRLCRRLHVIPVEANRRVPSLCQFISASIHPKKHHPSQSLQKKNFLFLRWKFFINYQNFNLYMWIRLHSVLFGSSIFSANVCLLGTLRFLQLACLLVPVVLSYTVL